MSITLEQVQILSQEYDLDENEYQKALDVMRGYVDMYVGVFLEKSSLSLRIS